MWFLRFGLCVGLLLVSGAISESVRAQSPRTESIRTPVRSELRDRIAERDSLLEFRTRRTARGRLDVEEGVLRAAYRQAVDTAIPAADDPVQAARAHLRDRAVEFGLDPELTDLRVADVRQTPFSRHVTFEQVLHDVPVLRRQVKVSLDASNRPTMVLSGYAPHLQTASPINPIPSLSAERARTIASEAFESTNQVSDAKLFVLAEEAPRLAWQVIAWPADRQGEWEVLIAAHSGEVVSLRDQASHARLATNAETSTFEGAFSLRAAPVESPGDVAVAARLDGSGLVFDPDPVTRAGTTYGGEFVDAGDADSEALNAQRTEVPLRDISQGTDGLYRLEGPYVQIIGSGLGESYSVPAETDPNAFRYTRSEPEFEAVMAYYHIDTSQRYVESLAAGTPTPRIVRVNPRGYSSDNSEFFPSQNAIIFGTGGIDDAEDGSVIRHEHAHAILNNTTPGLLSTLEGAAFHEGWADYWATSLLRQQIESGEVPTRDWTHVFPWDGNNTATGWCGRFLNHPGRYPDQTFVAPPSGCGAYPGIYQQGLLWATTLSEVYTALGHELADRLNLASHAYLNVPVTFPDAAEALIQADVDLYAGSHTGALISILGARGYVDVTAFGPIIVHDPLPNIETLGGTVEIEVMATGSSAEVDSVYVFYGTTAVPAQRLVLTPVGVGRYVGDLPLPNQPDTLRYYIEAVDEQRRRSFYPDDGPATALEVFVGPDHVPPTISHTPIQRASLAAWPATVTAIVTDALGVDSVWVSFSIADSTGDIAHSGTFGLTGDDEIYQSTFPVPVNELSSGDLVSYRIHARDVAIASNVAVVPEEGTFEFRVLSEGILREYDFESPVPGIVATGLWETGRPSYGVQVAHSGISVWGTRLNAAYPASPQRSTLELPPVNLQSVGQTYLVFWHWHDFEHNGQAVPDTMKQIPLWDGGNVKISTDGGASWDVTTPVKGYSGTIYPGLENPLGGEDGFGGYSFGWRRVIIPLPAESDVRIRFEFGTDLSNEDVSLGYAGWYVDDVSIVTVLPQDNEAPVATVELESELLRAPGQFPPEIVVVASDDVGIDLVEVRYELYPHEGLPSEGRFRLAMSDTSLTLYRGSFPSMQSFERGDRIEYRVFVRDYAGRETFRPARNEPPMRILYRNLGQIELLTDAFPSGHWTSSEAGWRIVQGPRLPESGLVLQPVDLPTNAERLTLEVVHQVILDPGAGGNVKITTDDGATWEVLIPEEGYTSTLDASGDHPMSGEFVFGGRAGEARVSRFDLSEFGGVQVQIRLDFGLTRELLVNETWDVTSASLILATPDAGFQVSRQLALHPNFPDPTSGTTNVSYTIAAPADVQLEVFDVLGRRVATIVDERQEPGTFTQTFDASRLQSGMYLIRLQAGSQQRVERMVVVR